MENYEAMWEILSDLEISLSIEQIKKLTEAYDRHLSILHEMSFYSHINTKQECEQCKRLTIALKEAKNKIDDYHAAACKLTKVGELDHIEVKDKQFVINRR